MKKILQINKWAKQKRDKTLFKVSLSAIPLLYFVNQQSNLEIIDTKGPIKEEQNTRMEQNASLYYYMKTNFSASFSTLFNDYSYYIFTNNQQILQLIKPKITEDKQRDNIFASEIDSVIVATSSPPISKSNVVPFTKSNSTTISNSILIPQQKKSVFQRSEAEISLDSEKANLKECKNENKAILKDSTPLSNSRYLSEFIQESQIGSGGFGKVFKVKNIFDQEQYAIKMIRIKLKNHLSSSSLPQKTLREVKTLAQLDHKNIIRYFSAWIEKESNKASNEDTSTNLFAMSGENETPQNSTSESSCEANNEIFNFEKENISLSKKPYDLFGLNNKSSGTPTNVFSSHTGHTGHTGHSTKTENTPNVSNSENNDGFSILNLFIQTKLYDGTLEEYLEHKDRKVDPELNKLIIRQILVGLDFLHSQHKLIHRDLKPSNLFLSVPVGELVSRNDDVLLKDDVVKIADFGLAKHLEEGSSEEIGRRRSSRKLSEDFCCGSIIPCSPVFERNGFASNSEDNSLGNEAQLSQSYHTTGIGSLAYVSPEQGLKSDVLNNIYDEKTDIYSLGIVVFELFSVFKTRMQRAKSLTKLRSGVCPSDFENYSRELSYLVSLMMNNDPNLRPSAKELLLNPLFSVPELLLNEKQIIQSQQSEIEKLKLELAMLKEKMGGNK